VNSVKLDETDRRILNAIQPAFPLCREPYAQIAEEVGGVAAEALARVRSLRERRVIRRIGGVLNARNLGLSTTLVAMNVPPERVEGVAAVVNALPNVTHNYLRDFDYNVWFTAAANSREELTELIERIKEWTGVADVLDLPSLRTYKIDVQLDFRTGGGRQESGVRSQENEQENEGERGPPFDPQSPIRNPQWSRQPGL